MSIWSTTYTNKAYLSAITVTNIYRSFYLRGYEMAAKISWHRCGTKLRHCQSTYRRSRWLQVQCTVMIDGFRAPRVVRPMTFYAKLRCVEDPLVIHFSEHCERRTASLRITYKPTIFVSSGMQKSITRTISSYCICRRISFAFSRHISFCTFLAFCLN